MGFNSGFKGLIYLNCMMMHGPAHVKFSGHVGTISNGKGAEEGGLVGLLK